MGLYQVRDYLEFAEATKDQWRILPMPGGGYATEVKFTRFYGNVQVDGFIDQIRELRDGSLQPADLKTGTRNPGSTMQLAVYADEVADQTGIRPTTGVFVKAGKPATEKVKAKPTADVMWELREWTPELLTDMFQTMDRMDKLGLFLPNPQDGCERTCGVASHCRIKGWDENRVHFATITTRPPKVSDEELAEIEELMANAA